MNTYETRKARSEAANRAFYAFMDAYADAIGEKPAIDDPETKAARRLAAEAFGFFTAYPVTDDDRATVSAMVEAIADSFKDAETEKARRAMFEASHHEMWAKMAFNRCSDYDDNTRTALACARNAEEHATAAAEAERIAWNAARAANTDEARELAEMASEDAASARSYAARASETANAAAKANQAANAAADPEARAVNPAPIYQRYELLAYLGDPDAYDVDAIEAEATRFTADGARVWSAFGSDLAAIAERHELYSYAPAI